MRIKRILTLATPVLLIAGTAYRALSLKGTS